MTKDERIERWLEGHRKWLKDPKNREHLSNKLKEFWSGDREELKESNRQKAKEYWDNKPAEEYALGERIPQKIDGVRDPESYRNYMRSFQQRYREQHKDYYKWLYQKRIGKTDLNYDMWKYFNKWRKK